MQGILHHVEIYVSDLEKTKLFWTWLLFDKLNYEIYQKWPSGISYKLGETYIVFVQTETEFIENTYHRKNTGLNHLAFHCDTRAFVDELTQELEEKNISILYKNKHPFAGGENYYAVFFEDPDRIKVEVVAKEKIVNPTI
jgi:catechol 2,3-dioxygenase-like lactoylglutathione lyase family enzyme